MTAGTCVEIEPWGRQSGESAAAFEAFATYRDMPRGRSGRQVAARLGKSPRLIARWSVRWQWMRRCELYAAYQDAQFRAENERAIRDFRTRAAGQARGSAQSMMLPIMALSTRIEDARAAGGDIRTLFANLSMSQLLALAIQGARVLPALLTAEGVALGDSPDRATDAVVAEQVDQLQQRINESPQLRGLAAVMIEIATTGPASRPGGRCEEYDPAMH